MGYAVTVPNVTVEYASAPYGTQAILNFPTDVYLGQIVIPSKLQGAIYQAYIDVNIFAIQDISGALNKLNGDQYVKIYVNSDWLTAYTAIKLLDNSFEVAANATNPFGRIYGNYDLSSYIKAGDTIDIYLKVGSADADVIKLLGFQSILRLVLGA